MFTLKQLLKRIRKMRDEELLLLSKEVDQEIQARLSQPEEDGPATLEFAEPALPYRGVEPVRPAGYGARRAA